MVKIVLSPLAKKSFRNVLMYYNEAPGKKEVIKKKINSGFKTLLTFPYAGKIEPIFEEQAKIYRSLVIDKHFKIIYRIMEDKIYIIALWDCRQHPAKILDVIN